jgi:hypothetical protein
MEPGATPQDIIKSQIVWDSAPVTVTDEALAATQDNRKREAYREAEAFFEAYLEAQPMPAGKVEAAAKEKNIISSDAATSPRKPQDRCREKQL